MPSDEQAPAYHDLTPPKKIMAGLPPQEASKVTPKMPLPCRPASPASHGRLLRYSGGALSAVRAQCNYLGIWPY